MIADIARKNMEERRFSVCTKLMKAKKINSCKALVDDGSDSLTMKNSLSDRLQKRRYNDNIITLCKKNIDVYGKWKVSLKTTNTEFIYLSTYFLYYILRYLNARIPTYSKSFSNLLMTIICTP